MGSKKQRASLAHRALALLAVASLACGTDGPPDGDPPEDDPTEALFAADHIIDVQVELDPTDWDTLRSEGRVLTEVFTGCADEYEYTYFHATVTVDGESYDDVAVRKKGFLGSISEVRPSLKLNFGKFVPERTHSGMKRMTLNNNLQDPSNTHQCMAYELFQQAGAIAPRCNFARVTVNGEDLGIYTHVESVKKPMLARHFDDNDGNLYEGQLADFTPELVDRMELKTNETENDRSDLDLVVAALQADDDMLIQELEQVVDLDAFLTFWAMEVMVGHWDSYTGGRNNYLTYHDPTSDRFYFIPWGTDGAFSATQVFNPENTAASVYAEGSIAYRLYHHPEGRAMYLARLRELFEALWDEDALLAEVDRIGALTDGLAVGLTNQRSFIRDQGERLRAELDATPVEWIGEPLAIAPVCLDITTSVSGTFDTTWRPFSPTMTGQTLDLTLDDMPWEPASLWATAEPDQQDPNTATMTLLSPLASNQFLAVLVRLPIDFFAPGTYEMHGFESSGVVVLASPATGDFQFLGFIGDGTITLDAASPVSGEPVRGSFQGRLVQLQPFQ